MLCPAPGPLSCTSQPFFAGGVLFGSAAALPAASARAAVATVTRLRTRRMVMVSPWEEVLSGTRTPLPLGLFQSGRPGATEGNGRTASAAPFSEADDPPKNQGDPHGHETCSRAVDRCNRPRRAG